MRLEIERIRWEGIALPGNGQQTFSAMIEKLTVACTHCGAPPRSDLPFHLTIYVGGLEKCDVHFATLEAALDVARREYLIP